MDMIYDHPRERLDLSPMSIEEKIAIIKKRHDKWCDDHDGKNYKFVRYSYEDYCKAFGIEPR